MAIALPRLRRSPSDPEARMGVVEHLEELRKRLVISIVAWLLCAIVAWGFYDQIISLIRLPLERGGRFDALNVEDLYVAGISTAFVLRIKVAAMAGFVIALPIVLWQIFRFIAPGLQRKERRIAIPFIASSVLLFLLGATMAYLILPGAINFMLGFAVDSNLTPLLQAHVYFSFVSFMVLGFGVSFQLPLVIVALGAVGAVSSQTLRKRRGWAIVIAFIVGALATPADPLSQTVMAVPLYLLYEASILVLRFGFKK